MAPSDIEQRFSEQSTTPSHQFPEWTREDDSDVDIASIAERQRVRFRAASVAGRQRYHSPPKYLLSALTRREISQEAHEIRAILEGRGIGDIGKGLGAATSTLLSGGAQAVGAVAQGIGNSGNAAASAIASGGGLGGAAAAAAGSVSNGISRGANAAAGAVAGAGGAFASAVAGSDTSDDDKKTKTKPPKNDPPKQTQEPPPPAQTNDPPQVTEAPPPPPRPSSPPPKETQPPPSPSQPQPSPGNKDPDPPKTTDKPIDNVPPPKAEQPSSKSSSDSPSNSSPDTSSSSDKGSPDPSPTTTDDDQKLSLSTLVPGATVTSQSGTRLLLTPVISSNIPGITSGVKKGTTGDQSKTTTPFAVAPGPSTMLTSVSPTLGPAPGQSGKPSSDNKSKEQGDNGKESHGGGLSPSGQSALISIGVLVGVCALFAIGFYFWRRRKQQMDPTYGGGSSFNPRSLFKGPFDRAKRGISNVASRIPYIRDRFPGKDRWEDIDDPYGDFFSEKKIITISPASDGPPAPFKEKLEPIKVQTTFTQRSSIVSQFNSTAGIGGTVSSVGISTMGAPSMGISPISEVAARASAMGPSAVGGSLAAASAPNNKPIQTSPFEVPGDMPEKPSAKPALHIASQARQLVGVGTNHGPKPSFSSTAPQYNLTLPSTLGARRISDLSSLSSGFGDGDIVVPSKTARKSTASSNHQNATRENERNRNSTATTATAKSNLSGRRDTVYTEASEDSPPRFRTVNSWVRQQSGRVKREKQREEDAATKSGTPPPVPAIPPEQEFRLMMPDGEEPRRVEDTPAGTDDWGAQTNSMLKVVIGTAH
ncbi:hypothetical protein PWT90_04863 [Aphanocladium album]|nr:hypothetical protein PWT90_04863 [Aphanocladium album]